MGYMAYMPTRVLFGRGKLNELHEQKMPGKKALLIISNGNSVKANGTLDRTIDELNKANVKFVLFDEIEANPLKETVMRGGLKALNNNCDFIVALGGGSVMDASKAIAVMAVNDGDIWDYINGGTGKAKPVKNKPLPIITITTTAGTGSEVDQWGVISNAETNEKIGFGGIDELFPVIAIVDPELMLIVPPKYTAYQGFDALFHSTEVYISKYANLMSDMVALTAIKNIGKYLAAAVKNGSDIKAREHVAFANTMSGYAMVTGSCTSEHSMEHAMSAFHQSLPHGAGLIMISVEYYKHFISKHICDEKFVDMAKALGKNDATRPEDFIEALIKLQKDCGVADLKMSDYGIKITDADAMAHNARTTMGGLFESDPCQLSHEECVKIYVKSYR